MPLLSTSGQVSAKTEGGGGRENTGANSLLAAVIDDASTVAIFRYFGLREERERERERDAFPSPQGFSYF